MKWIRIIAVLLLAAELVYFRIADKCNIIDKPNERSSHSTVVLRGGGVIFAFSMLVWVGLQGVHGDWGVVLDYLPFLIGLVIIAGVSFIDDIHSLPDSVRLVAQFIAMGLAAWCLIQGSKLMGLDWYWLVLIGIAVLGQPMLSTLWTASMVLPLATVWPCWFRCSF